MPANQTVPIKLNFIYKASRKEFNFFHSTQLKQATKTNKINEPKIKNSNFFCGRFCNEK